VQAPPRIIRGENLDVSPSSSRFKKYEPVLTEADQRESPGSEEEELQF
jgi:hypothetical protein